MSSNINDYIKPTDYGQTRKDVNRILSLIHDLVAQEPEDEGAKSRGMYTPHVKLRTTSVTFGSPSLLDTDSWKRETFIWKRKKPASVYAYDLIHTTFGSGLTFPVTSTWRGAKVKNDGTSYVIVTDHDNLSPTDKISICMRLNLPSSAGGFTIIEKLNEYRLRVVDTNKIEWAVYSGGAYKTALTYTYTPSTSFSLVATYKSTSSGQKLYINGSLYASDSETGALTPTANNLGIMSNSSGGSIVKANYMMGLLGIIHNEVDSTWVTNYENYLYDTSGSNLEITTITFVGNESATPDSEAGLFMAG